MAPVRVPATYIFAGRAKAGAKGQIEPEPGSLSPVRDLIFFVDDLAKKGEVVCWRTDAKGLIYPLETNGNPRPTAVHSPGKDLKIYLPPPDALLKAWAKNRDDWAEELRKGVTKHPKYNFSQLGRIEVPKAALRAPDRQSKDPGEQEWGTFVDGLQGKERITALVLPTVRALVMPFSSAVMAGTTVEVVPEGKAAISCAVESDDGKAFAVALGDEKTLPAGLYTFNVRVPLPAPASWSGPVVKERTYKLKEQVRFGITNFAGEFEVVSCDPISLEESVLQQFPALYWHRIAAAKRRESYPEIETEPEYAEVPKALEEWADRMEWTHAKAKLAVGMINASGWNKRAALVGKAVWKKVQPENELLAATRHSIDLAFQVRQQIKDWKEIIEDAHAGQELAGLKKLLAKDLDSYFERQRWWTYAKEQFVDAETRGTALALAKATDAERKVILAAGIPEKRTNLEELAGKSAGKTIQKGLVAAQLAIDVYKTAVAFSEVMKARKDEQDLVGDLDVLFDQVKSTIASTACREAIGNLERLRAATVAAHRKLDDKEAEALMSAIDAVLGALTLVFPPVAIVVAVKETLTLAKDVAVDLGEWLDRIAFKGLLADLYSRQYAQMAELARASTANQALMPKLGADGGAANLNVQLRLRAEAIHGLVALFTRAGVASKNEKEYLERVQKYRVVEYVQHFLLNDGWQLPVRPMVPIGMDAAWLYLTSPYGQYRTEMVVNEQLGYTSPLKAGALQALPGGMTMLLAVDAVMTGNAVARFQGPFPIHRTHDDFNELAKAFRTSWREFGPSAVEYTCIYRRPPGSTGPGGWQAVNANGVKEVGKLDLLSPLDQVRVLVVFKPDVKACLPLSFQLVRTDGINIKGPVYREISRKLDKDNDLLPDEAKFDGRMGCVFHPFYEFGKQIVPGIKPLASSAGWTGAAAYEAFGNLADMRYAFDLKVGDDAETAWVSIGAAHCARSEVDEVRVGFTGMADERRLLVADFLDSHSEKFTYPLLFQMVRGFGPCYVRVGKDPWQLATPEQDGTLTFKQFDWNQPVEFVVVAWSESIAWADWERMQLDWKRVPVQMQLVGFTGTDDDGPTYSSDLNYLGQVSTSGPALPSGGETPDEAVAEWAAQVGKNKDGLARLVAALDPQNYGSMAAQKSSYHLYAAHFALDYSVPGGGSQKGLRPFGKVLTGRDNFYRIGVRNLRTAEKCNLEATKMVAPLAKTWSSVARAEYEFRFAAPESHFKDVPWAKAIKDQKALEKWIKDQATKRDPNVELMKK